MVASGYGKVVPPKKCFCSAGDVSAGATVTCDGSTKNTSGGPAGGGMDESAVSLNNGQHSIDLRLLRVAALGKGSFEFGLRRLSGLGASSVAGKSFNFTQNARLTQSGADPTSSAIELTTVDSVVQTFTVASHTPSTVNYSSQSSTPANITGATLARYNLGTENEYFTMTAGDGTVATYSGINSNIATPGQITGFTDRNGNSQALSWTNTNGVVQLTGVTDSYGRTVQYSYYGSQYNYALQQITDYQGRSVNFQYDTLGHLVAVVGPSINEAPTGGGYPGGTAYVYQYDVNNPRPQRQDDLIAIWYPNQVQPYLNTDPTSSGFRTVDVAAVYAGAQPREQMVYG